MTDDSLLDILVDVLSTGANDHDALTKSIEGSFTFATVHGSIGTVKTISHKAFELFSAVQKNILAESTSIGNLKYASWRNYKPQLHHHQDMTTYLDGDLLKKFQYFNLTIKHKILQHDLLKNYTIVEMEGLINSLVS